MAKGGARPGAGRPPKRKIPFAPKSQAVSVLNKLGSEFHDQKLPTEDELWLSMLIAKDLRIRLDALKYLTDRRDGKPAQNVEVTGKEGGPIPVVLHTIRFGNGDSDR